MDYSDNPLIENIEIPDTVTEIGKYAFKKQDKLKKIILPKGLKIISEGMFFYCRSLEELVIADGV